MGVVEPLIEHRQRFAGHETRVLELEGEGPPIVLIHGFADSADTWRYVLDRLAKRGRRAVAIDLPGFGTCERLEPGPILPQLDKFALAVTKHAAGDGKAVVAGNSLGGCLALRMAQVGKAPLAGIVPVAPAGLDSPVLFTVVERDVLVRTVMASPVPLPELTIRGVVAQLYLRIAFRHAHRVDPRAVRAFTSHIRTKARAQEVIDIARRLPAELRQGFDLCRIACPVHVIWGTHDRMTPVRAAKRIEEEVPHAVIDLVEDCGHCPQIELPERVADVLLDFPVSLANAA